MNRPRICVSIVDKDLEAIKEIEPDVDMFEVRIDLIGPEWPDLVHFLDKPWIACNRSPDEGGRGNPDQVKRIAELMWAAEAGASIIDIEHRTKGLPETVRLIKARAQCLISYHDIMGTPSFNTLVGIVESQIRAGADICKIVTSATSFEDNLTILKLISRFPEVKMVAMAMGEEGRLTRVLSPLAGGYFTYACMAPGKESSAGQIPIKEMKEIYGYLRNAK
jgi:3-dehydroquinate dehydratase type I